MLKTNLRTITKARRTKKTEVSITSSLTDVGLDYGNFLFLHPLRTLVIGKETQNWLLVPD